jgi:hypothetical protein
MPGASPEELARKEVQLFTRLTAARENYRKAKAEAEILNSIQADLTLNHPDGRASALKAAQIEDHALTAYVQALQEFTDFILHKLPRKPDTGK